MNKIDLNIQAIDLDGNPLLENDKPVFLGKLLGNHLVSSNKGDAIKYYDWAVKIYKGESILVDDSDLKNIKDFVKNSETFTILSKAQILKQLDKTEKIE